MGVCRRIFAGPTSKLAVNCHCLERGVGDLSEAVDVAVVVLGVLVDAAGDAAGEGPLVGELVEGEDLGTCGVLTTGSLL